MSRIKTIPGDRMQEVGAEILGHLAPQPGDSLVLIEGDDFVLVKRASRPLSQRFEELADATRERFEQLGIEPDDVTSAVRWARESS
jgi:hypothetical protein